MEPETASTLVSYGRGSLFDAVMGRNNQCWCVNASCLGNTFPACVEDRESQPRCYVHEHTDDERAAAASLTAVRLPEGVGSILEPSLVGAASVAVRVPRSAADHASGRGELTWWMPLDTASVCNLMSEDATKPVHAVMLTRGCRALPPLVWGTLGLLVPQKKGCLPRVSLEWVRSAWRAQGPLPVPRWLAGVDAGDKTASTAPSLDGERRQRARQRTAIGAR